MSEEKNQIKKKQEIKKDNPSETNKTKAEEKVQEKLVTEEKEVKTEEKQKIEIKKDLAKKDIAIANASSLRISPKHAFAICKVIKGKTPENAVLRLEDVLKKKRAIPMASREVAHQKGKGLAGAKYPSNACKEIISVIKQLQANASIVGIENPVIILAKADKAPRPYRSGGRKGKRTHLHLEAKEKSKLKNIKRR